MFLLGIVVRCTSRRGINLIVSLKHTLSKSAHIIFERVHMFHFIYERDEVNVSSFQRQLRDDLEHSIERLLPVSLYP